MAVLRQSIDWTNARTARPAEGRRRARGASVRVRRFSGGGCEDRRRRLEGLHQPVRRRALRVLVAADAALRGVVAHPEPGGGAQHGPGRVEQLQLHRGVGRDLHLVGAVVRDRDLAEEPPHDRPIRRRGTPSTTRTLFTVPFGSAWPGAWIPTSIV